MKSNGEGEGGLVVSFARATRLFRCPNASGDWLSASPWLNKNIRSFRWDRKSGSPQTVPVEWFRLESTTLDEVEKPHLLVLWIKDQDVAPY